MPVCPGHADVDVSRLGHRGYEIEIFDKANIGYCRTGSMSGYDYCELCGVVVYSSGSTDDPAGFPNVGSIIDPLRPSYIPGTDETW